MRRIVPVTILSVLVVSAGCAQDSRPPTAPSPVQVASVPETGASGPSTALEGAAAGAGPQVPPFDLEAILRGEAGFGLVKFRQPNDAQKVIYLDVWVRDLEANHAYRLQRAVDVPADGTCTSSSWLTLGQGLSPLAITTDDRGTGRASLWRDVSAIASGALFDIRFRIVDDTTQVPVLTSECYQYVVNP